MGLETASYISQLVSSNPQGTDGKNAGDNHLRLIKSVLQTTFPNLDRAITFGGWEALNRSVLAKTASYSQVIGDLGKLVSFELSTSSVYTLLPVASAGAGFVCFIRKGESVNPLQLQAAGSENIEGENSIWLGPGESGMLWCDGSSWFFLWFGGKPEVGKFETFGHDVSADNRYLPRDGRAVSRVTYVRLFNLYGTTYGAGNGTTTFNLPDSRGRVSVALDNVGGTAGNIVQKATTISTTSGNTSATVASAAGLCPGMYIVSQYVPVGTKISSINGTTVVMSAAATATQLDVAARFSFFEDAGVLGSKGGDNAVALINSQLPTTIIPAHSHFIANSDSGSGSDGGSLPSPGLYMLWKFGTSPDGRPSYVLAGNGTVADRLSTSQQPAYSFGADAPHGNLQPSELGYAVVRV